MIGNSFAERISAHMRAFSEFVEALKEGLFEAAEEFESQAPDPSESFTDAHSDPCDAHKAVRAFVYTVAKRYGWQTLEEHRKSQVATAARAKARQAALKLLCEMTESPLRVCEEALDAFDGDSERAHEWLLKRKAGRERGDEDAS